MPIHRIAWCLAVLFALSGCEQRAPSTDAFEKPSQSPTEPVATGTPPKPSADTALVLPGAFAESTSVSDFETRFGKPNITLTEVQDTDGRTLRSLVLFPDDPTRRAYVTFHDPEAMTGVASIRVDDAGSLWRGKHGVHVGMSLAELRRVNGKPFHFSGFDDERRGWVRDQWSVSIDDADATLGALDVAADDQMYFGVDLGVRGADVPADAYPQA